MNDVQPVMFQKLQRRINIIPVFTKQITIVIIWIKGVQYIICEILCCEKFTGKHA